MFANRISRIVIVVAVVAIALLSASFAVSPKSNQPYQDYALRHPYGIGAPASQADSTDYFFRHSELTLSKQTDTTDYYFRHTLP